MCISFRQLCLALTRQKLLYAAHRRARRGRLLQEGAGTRARAIYWGGGERPPCHVPRGLTKWSKRKRTGAEAGVDAPAPPARATRAAAAWALFRGLIYRLVFHPLRKHLGSRKRTRGVFGLAPAD